MKFLTMQDALNVEAGIIRLRHIKESTMSRLTIVAALIAATAYASEASAARSNGTSRQTETTASDRACVRAPNVGAFATAPYTSPPCVPARSN
jgi:hypothetical protein